MTSHALADKFVEFFGEDLIHIILDVYVFTLEYGGNQFTLILLCGFVRWLEEHGYFIFCDNKAFSDLDETSYPDLLHTILILKFRKLSNFYVIRKLFTRAKEYW